MARARGAGSELVALAGAGVSAGADGVRLVGAATRGALLDRISLAERIRSEQRPTVAVRGPSEFRSDLVEGLLAGRLDLIDLE